MSMIAVLSALAAVQLAALTSPAPNILVIGQAASGHSRAIGLFTALGLATAATAWAIAALVGLSLLQTYGAFLYPILRIVAHRSIEAVGGGSLIVAGTRLLLASHKG